MGIIESEIAGQLLSGLGDALVGMQVDVLVLHALPQPLDEHVVDPAPLAVQADPDGVGLENLGEVVACELAALIGVEDLRAPYLAIASSRASTQKSAVMLIETRWASTRRVAQSMMATRYTKPRRIGM